MKKFLICVATASLIGCPKAEEKSAKSKTPAKPKTKAASTQPSKAASSRPAATPPPPAANDIPAPADVAAAPKNAETRPSGLASVTLKPGTGTTKPGPTDIVVVHYTGWTTDGKMFDSSVKRGQPATFPLNRVIPGWTEGVGLMVVGEKRRFWIPGKMAYGDKPQRPGAPAGTLVFDVELLEIKKAPPPPKPIPAPKNVAAAPKNAKKTPSGLAYTVLKKGDGTTKPAATSVVRVHYSGWTTDGKMFDSSVQRGQPATFPLNRVIPGWTEGLQLMSVGGKNRFWIPGNLAYGDKPKRPGAPSGTLVFDVELLEIVKAPPSPGKRPQ
jgi:peptidylprolyl isomerase